MFTIKHLHVMVGLQMVEITACVKKIVNLPYLFTKSIWTDRPEQTV